MNPALCELLAERLEQSGCEWRQLADASALAAFLAEAGWTGAADALDPAGLLDDGRGFALLDGVIAETASLALSARHRGARRGAFLAETHFALCADECVVPRLADLLARFGSDYSARAGHSLTLITGPSRTADIEKTLVLGAHGPRRLVLATAPAVLLRDRFAPGALPPEAAP
jgi:hypothetical protein